MRWSGDMVYGYFYVDVFHFHIIAYIAVAHFLLVLYLYIFYLFIWSFILSNRAATIINVLSMSPQVFVCIAWYILFVPFAFVHMFIWKMFQLVFYFRGWSLASKSNIETYEVISQSRHMYIKIVSFIQLTNMCFNKQRMLY